MISTKNQPELISYKQIYLQSQSYPKKTAYKHKKKNRPSQHQNIHRFVQNLTYISKMVRLSHYKFYFKVKAKKISSLHF